LLEASRKVGLDFRSLVGRNVEMRKTPVGQAPVEGSVVTAYVLIADGAPAGAWLGVSNSVPGILALSERP
jgi:hypothetical protein